MILKLRRASQMRCLERVERFFNSAMTTHAIPPSAPKKESVGQSSWPESDRSPVGPVPGVAPRVGSAEPVEIPFFRQTSAVVVISH